MMFCFDFGPGCEEKVRKAYAVLKEEAKSYTPIGECEYITCQFTLIDKFGIYWCLFL